MSTLITTNKQYCGCGERLPTAIPRRLFHRCKCGRTFRATLQGLTSLWVPATESEYSDGIKELP